MCPADFDHTEGRTIMFGATRDREMLPCVHIAGYCSCFMFGEVEVSTFEEGVLFEGFAVEISCATEQVFEEGISTFILSKYDTLWGNNQKKDGLCLG